MAASILYRTSLVKLIQTSGKTSGLFVSSFLFLDWPICLSKLCCFILAIRHEDNFFKTTNRHRFFSFCIENVRTSPAVDSVSWLCCNLGLRYTFFFAQIFARRDVFLSNLLYKSNLQPILAKMLCPITV